MYVSDPLHSTTYDVKALRGTEPSEPLRNDNTLGDQGLHRNANRKNAT